MLQEIEHRFDVTKTPEIREPVVVYTTGTFDILHPGHITMLNDAKKFGDFLIVALNTDEFVASYKGKTVMPYEERKFLLENIKSVDMVIPRNSFEDVSAVDNYGASILVTGRRSRGGNEDRFKALGTLLEEREVKILEVEGMFMGKPSSSSKIKQRIREG